MRNYKLEKIGQLLFTTGAVKGKAEVMNFTLLVDTGSTYTILPWEPLEKIGLDPSLTDKKVSIVTASGIVYAPMIKVDWFSCLGKSFKSFPIVVHTLPPGLSPFGLLGIDFMRLAKVRIDVFDRSISLRK